jgi:site-specific DNA-methyltransferase (adenine-specific)
MWVYGSGFPKSLDVSKAIDKQSNVQIEVLSEVPAYGIGGNATFNGHKENATAKVTAPTTDKAKQWAGWGTALKPAHEPIVLARKPLIGTVATNVIIHGTGALNIDGSRVGTEQTTTTIKDLSQAHGNNFGKSGITYPRMGEKLNPVGRWPANFIHDGSDEVVELFPNTTSKQTMRGVGLTASNVYGSANDDFDTLRGHNDSGSAARFFYCAKASKKDRNEGLDDFAGKEVGTKGNGLARTCASCGASTLQGCECPDRTYVNPTRANHHPTVKPTELMRYLVRMVTPPDGTVLDPFMGSGSTGKAAVLERFNFIGIDQSADYLEIATARIKHAQEQVEGQLL